MTFEPRIPDRAGIAAGVPYVAYAPATASPSAPLVIVLHLMDPPRSERAMAAALPLHGLDAWRVYFGLPMFGSRTPPGGPDEVMRLAYEDALTNLFAPVVEQAAAELPEATDAVREQLGLGNSALALVGGSAGGAAVLFALAQSDISPAAVALINPASRAAAVIEAGERVYGITYAWNEHNRARAEELDFVKRVSEITRRSPAIPILLVVGEADERAFLEATGELGDALTAGYGSDESVRFVRIAGLGHGLAEEPGIDPAPQSAGAARVDAEVTTWLRRYL